MADINVPALPGGSGRVARWLAAPGDLLVPGAPLVIVVTERAEVLLPAPAAGALADPVPAGATVAPGALLARLVPAAGDRPSVERQDPAAHPQLRATPLARRIARAQGVALSAVKGTGPAGRVDAADVRALAPGSPRPPVPLPPRPPAASAPRPQARAASERVPVATATVELDVGVALASAAALRELPGRPRLPVGLTALVVAAAAALLPAYAELNGAWGGEVAVLRRRVHIAVGEPGPAGLRWALVRDAADLTPRGVARALAGADGAAGAATFAVVSLADGVSWQGAVPPIPGTSAALSVGAPVSRAVAQSEGVAVRPVARLTLSYDARLIDHRRAVAFLWALCRRLEQG